MNILREIQRRFADALAGMSDNPAELVGQVRASQDPKFGDYQANCAMPLGQAAGQAAARGGHRDRRPAEIDDLCEPPEIAGPGFINLRLRNDWLAQQAAGGAADRAARRADGRQAADLRRRLLAPNVAKPMHVGHIRSTVIGDCAVPHAQIPGP